MKRRRNDSDREQWVNNEESLYYWYLSTGIRPLLKFIKYYRMEIDRYIDTLLDKEQEE